MAYVGGGGPDAEPRRFTFAAGAPAPARRASGAGAGRVSSPAMPPASPNAPAPNAPAPNAPAPNAPDLVPVRRALLSVSDKSGVADFARALHEEFGVELLSTGGTAKALRDAGLPVTDVADVTGFPEMMAGRVKTLHPNIHGGLLARLPDDAAVMAEHGIAPIDLLCVNLYPFEQTVAREGCTYEEAVEQIDIGGPAMVRSAAKNHTRVVVVTGRGQYDNVLTELREHRGASRLRLRRDLAARAFGRTLRYDRAIENFLDDSLGDVVTRRGRTTLRYGENPHQRARLFRDAVRPDEASVAWAEQLHGKELGYINLLDADAALQVVKEFDRPACCIVKHATPCGVGAGERPAEAFDRAYAGDPLAAFGGIVAFNRPVDDDAAEAVCAIDKLLEVLVAPSFAPSALDRLKNRWKNARLLAVGPMRQDGEPLDRTIHRVVGGVLDQDRDLTGVVEAEWKVVSARPPTDAELAALKFNWLACKHVKSNAVVVGGPEGTYGIGGGQVDRVAAARHAVEKAGGRTRGAVAASDAFFPFPDGPQLLLDAGVTAVVQPGGSVKDQLTIDLVNERGAAMVFTGRRHFRH